MLAPSVWRRAPVLYLPCWAWICGRAGAFICTCFNVIFEAFSAQFQSLYLQQKENKELFNKERGPRAWDLVQNMMGYSMTTWKKYYVTILKCTSEVNVFLLYYNYGLCETGGGVVRRKFCAWAVPWNQSLFLQKKSWKKFLLKSMIRFNSVINHQFVSDV